MTDTKYVPSHAEVFRLLLQFWTGERCRIPLSSQDARTILAQPLRVAGPDEAIVPLDALRIARMAVASWANSSLADEGNRAALAAIDAAIAMTNSEPSMVGSARSAPTQVGFVQFRMRDLERLVAMYLDAAANVPRGDDGRDEEAIDNARAAIAAATPPEQTP